MLKISVESAERAGEVASDIAKDAMKRMHELGLSAEEMFVVYATLASAFDHTTSFIDGIGGVTGIKETLAAWEDDGR